MSCSARWVTHPPSPALANEFARCFDVPLSIGQALVARGFSSPDDVRLFFNPRLENLEDPFLLPDMKKAVDLTRHAVQEAWPITIFGDYDVDGITSVALLAVVLRQMGGQVQTFIPERRLEGYGFSPEALKRCVQITHPKLIITVDCGTSSAEAVSAARELGVQVIITDHHECVDAVAPAAAVVNPKRNPLGSGMALAGVGVAFKFCHALIKQQRQNGVPHAPVDLRNYLDWVALGTVCDMSPLTGENRILVAKGLQQFSQTQSVGIKALAEVSSVDLRAVDAYALGFQLGPRLNAVGRLSDAESALRLLLTEDPVEAHTLAVQLNESNRERQAVERAILDEAQAKLDGVFDVRVQASIVLWSAGWHPGVIGIVASRLSRKYSVPAIIIALDEKGDGRGSCRSVEGVDITKLLESCAGHLEKWGGHTQAAGLNVAGSQLASFSRAFNEAAERAIPIENRCPLYHVDAWLAPEEINENLLGAEKKMEPFGTANPRPVWGMMAVHLAAPPRIVGQHHLKLRLALPDGDIEVIGFGMGGIELSSPMDILFHLHPNYFRGESSLELRAVAVRSAFKDEGERVA